MNHFDTHASATEAEAQMEKVIRDIAGATINMIKSRESHPTYGYTLGVIRGSLEKMEGAIGMYAVVTGQANHPFASGLTEFKTLETADRVAMARRMVGNLARRTKG